MPSVRRHIHVDAPPDLVRRFLDDPGMRRGWLDEEVELSPTEDGSRRFSDDRGAVERHVHIRVDPDDGGARVTVTESLGDEPDDAVEPTSDREVVALHGWRERHGGALDRQRLDDAPAGEVDGDILGEDRPDPLRPLLLAA